MNGVMKVAKQPCKITSLLDIMHGGTSNKNLVHVADLGREAAVHAHDLRVDEAVNRDGLEDIAEPLPHLDVAPVLAPIVKAIDSRDQSALVVPVEQEASFWELRLRDDDLLL